MSQKYKAHGLNGTTDRRSDSNRAFEAHVQNMAPGAPGQAATWTSGAKTGVGKALGAGSEVTFTISRGIVNEVYYPREDIASVREMGMIVCREGEWSSLEKDIAVDQDKMIAPGIPAYRIDTTSKSRHYSIRKDVIVDPIRNTLLQKVRMTAKKKDRGALSFYVTLCPHVRNMGMENTGWVGDYKGIPMLFAAHEGLTMALACSQPWLKRSCGFAGVSDGITDILQHKQMTWEYTRADLGSIVLTAQVDLSASDEFVLALGFGRTADDAANKARASLLDGFESAYERYVSEWKEWQGSLNRQTGKGGIGRAGKYFKESAAVLKMSESKRFPGGIIASMAIPWGLARGDDEMGGYHLVWPRDLVESAFGFLALKAKDEARRILNYLMSVQEADGSWSQNMWLEGVAYAKGLQLDEIALPVLLAEACLHDGIMDHQRLTAYWPGLRKALCFLIVHGPMTPEERWEQQSGLSPFTLASCIAALLAGAALAEANGDHALAVYCRETADAWNDQVENWTYVTETSIAQVAGVEGYYIRINPYYLPVSEVKDQLIRIKHYPGNQGDTPVGDIICADALALVRFGLRAADDPRILNTIKVIDQYLKMDTPSGPCWRRFVGDAYGEDEQGEPFVKYGVGRAWPLLTGERAHYEIAAGYPEKAHHLMKAMEAFSTNGFFPEQVWDAPDKPEKGLFFGKATGSAMPLTWAHAEYIKLGASLKGNKIFDTPLHTRKRYIVQKKESPFVIWRFDRRTALMPAGKTFRIELLASALVHWSDNDWATSYELHTRDTGTGIYLADIPAAAEADAIRFTFYWTVAGTWENMDFSVEIAGAAVTP